jgi:hypothetical protein
VVAEEPPEPEVIVPETAPLRPPRALWLHAVASTLVAPQFPLVGGRMAAEVALGEVWA